MWMHDGVRELEASISQYAMLRRFTKGGCVTGLAVGKCVCVCVCVCCHVCVCVSAPQSEDSGRSTRTYEPFHVALQTLLREQALTVSGGANGDTKTGRRWTMSVLSGSQSYLVASRK